MRISKTHADRTNDYGAVVERTSEVDGYSVNLVTFNDGQDIGAILASLPTGACECPHFGYVIAGRIDVRYADGTEETVSEGEAFYLPAGHTSWRCEAGTEMVQFSPTELLAETDAAIMKAMAAQG